MTEFHFYIILSQLQCVLAQLTESLWMKATFSLLAIASLVIAVAIRFA